MSDTTYEQSPDPGLLTDIYSDLHKSGEVGWAVQQSPEHVPNDPKDRVATYLGSLAGRHGMLGGSEERRQAQIDYHTMDPEDVPEGYFEHQRQIAREQGHGDIEITQEMRAQLTEALIADQTASLESWVEYTNHPDADYPEWFRYYTLRNVLKLADYDKEKGRFKKRSRGTTAPYPELNREALAYVYDKLEDRQQGRQQDDPEVQQLVQSANFNKLYSHALRESMPASPEQLTDTAGEWAKYGQLEYDEDSDRARQLAESLQGHGTGWCSAGERTAEMQLKGGDFYVYYSYDETEEATVPRAAIRMENGQVAEVRGIDANQELEPAMFDIVLEQLEDLPGGSKYIQKAEDMKRLTAIEKKITTDPDIELSGDELSFLYELDHEIQGFGYVRDPRVGKLRSERDVMRDMQIVFETDDHAKIARQLIESGERWLLVENLDKFNYTPDLAQTLIENGCGYLVAYDLDKFEDIGMSHADLARQLIESDEGFAVVHNLDKFEDIGMSHTEFAQVLVENGRTYLVAENLDKFEDIGMPHADFANTLIKNGRADIIANNLDKFDRTPDLAEVLIENGLLGIVAENLDKFEDIGMPQPHLVSRLLHSGQADILAENLDKFDDLYPDLARHLIDNGLVGIVAENLDKFKDIGMSHTELAQQLIENGKTDTAAHNLDKFDSETQELIRAEIGK